MHDAHAELLEGAIDQREIRRRAVAHDDVAIGDRAQREERRDLVEVLVEGELAAAELLAAMHGHARGADALDARAHHRHEAAELLHMRFGRGVGQRRGATGRGRAHHEVLGGGHRRVVEPMVDRPQRTFAVQQQRALRAFDLAAEAAEDLDVRIDLAHAQRAALDVVLEPRDAEAAQQRRHQHDRGAHFLGQMVAGGVEHGVAVMQVQRAAVMVHADIGAKRAEDIEDLAHVGDVRHPVQPHRLVGQQGGAQHRQDSVLVGGGYDAATQRRAAMHDQIRHEGRASVPRRQAAPNGGKRWKRTALYCPGRRRGRSPAPL